MKISELKAQAKQDISKTQQGMLILDELINDGVASAASAACGVGQLVVGGPMSVGLVDVYEKNARGEKSKVGDLFSGFNNFGRTFVGYLLTSIFVFLWSLLLIVPGIIKALAYSMVPYLQHEDKELSGSAAIANSMVMMEGHKGKLFLLRLSFIGWDILSALTCGILYICYVGPYYHACEYRFYQAIKAENAQGTAPEEQKAPEADAQ